MVVIGCYHFYFLIIVTLIPLQIQIAENVPNVNVEKEHNVIILG